MSGAKRRTKYRKGVTNATLNEFPEPEEGQTIVEVLASRGGNLFEVATAAGESGLCMLPTKFKNLVWVKRGAYLIASRAVADVSTVAKAKASVTFYAEHILLSEQVEHLKKRGLWPDFSATRGAVESKSDDARPPMDLPPTSSDDEEESDGAAKANEGNDDDNDDDDDDEEGDSDSDEDPTLFVNTNRHRLPSTDSDDDSDDDDEEE